MFRNLGLRRIFLAGVGIAALAASSCISAASASTTSKTVKPDLAFYAGKTITYIIPQAPGGTFSFSQVPASQLVGTYLHATVNDVYVSAASGIVGDQEIYAAPPDGLTIGDMTLGTLITNVLATGNTAVNFSLQKLTYLAGIPQNPIAIVTCGQNSPFANMTMKQILKLQTPWNFLNSGNGSGYIFVKVLLNLYHSVGKSFSGFATTALTTAACIGGDAPIGIQSVASLTTAELAAGQVKPLLVGIPVSKKSVFYPYFKHTPSLAQFFAENPVKNLPAAKPVEATTLAELGSTAITQWPAGPPGIPAGRVAALRAAWKYALTRPSVIQNEVSNSVGFGWRDPATALPYIKGVLKHQTIMQRFINQ